MIPVTLQPEPPDFNVQVRDPGRTFLRMCPTPTKKQWKHNAYWQRAQENLRRAYGGICAYCAEWIPPNTGETSIDHFIPRVLHPQLAYEWSNYRLAASRYNHYKADYTDVLDPFTLQRDWFVLEITSLQLKPNDTLDARETSLVWDTINRLHLNDQRAIDSRERWIGDYCDGFFNFDYLKRCAPFIAYELERQGLSTTIVAIVKGSDRLER